MEHPSVAYHFVLMRRRGAKIHQERRGLKHAHSFACALLTERLDFMIPIGLIQAVAAHTKTQGVAHTRDNAKKPKPYRA